MAYAFYNNVGKPDPAFELTFDRIKKPVKTTLDSSLCEVYSVFGKEQEAFLQRVWKKGEAPRGRTKHQGPSVSGMDGLSNPAAEVRSGLGELDFFRSAYRFANHFNNICKRLGQTTQLRQLDEIHASFNNSYYGVLLTREMVTQAKLTAVDGSQGTIIPINFDFDTQDPTLNDTLDMIERAYQKGLKSRTKYFCVL